MLCVFVQFVSVNYMLCLFVQFVSVNCMLCLFVQFVSVNYLNSLFLFVSVQEAYGTIEQLSHWRPTEPSSRALSHIEQHCVVPTAL